MKTKVFVLVEDGVAYAAYSDSQDVVVEVVDYDNLKSSDAYDEHKFAELVESKIRDRSLKKVY